MQLRQAFGTYQCTIQPHIQGMYGNKAHIFYYKCTIHTPLQAIPIRRPCFLRKIFKHHTASRTLTAPSSCAPKGSLITVSVWCEEDQRRRIHWQMEPEEGGPKATWVYLICQAIFFCELLGFIFWMEFSFFKLKDLFFFGKKRQI